MGAQTALSRKVQPRHEKIDADLLTPRQREILRLVSIGHTNREIADVWRSACARSKYTDST